METFLIWPHRSLNAKGMAILISGVVIGFGITLATSGGLRYWPIIAVVFLTVFGLVYGLWRNSQAVRNREIVEVSRRAIRVCCLSPVTQRRTIDFNPYWVKVRLTTDRYVEDRVVLSEGQKRRSVGDILSAPERRTLAKALQESIDRHLALYQRR
ncbi:MAG: DUF2244 domain-containing protein [Alphaproteobacteria bacterium]|nr:DUF2244 domain-containing protein [Alphaproteobacteria bacterium]